MGHGDSNCIRNLWLRRSCGHVVLVVRLLSAVSFHSHSYGRSFGIPPRSPSSLVSRIRSNEMQIENIML